MIQFVSLKQQKEKLQNIKKLYLEAFPAEERVPFFYLKYKLSRPSADCFHIYADGRWIGFLYIVFYEDIVFVFYFAVQSDVRGMGYGSQILDKLKSLYPHRRFILNIEEPDEGSDNHEQRRKRKQFYLRNGFRECRFKMIEKNVVYEMLCCGDDVTYPEYEQLIKNYLGSRLYKLYYKVYFPPAGRE